MSAYKPTPSPSEEGSPIAGADVISPLRRGAGVGKFVGGKTLQRLDANRSHEPCKDGILLLPLFPEGRRGLERGGSVFSLPLSPALSPLVPSWGEREAKDRSLILRFMESLLDILTRIRTLNLLRRDEVLRVKNSMSQKFLSASGDVGPPKAHGSWVAPSLKLARIVPMNLVGSGFFSLSSPKGGEGRGEEVGFSLCSSLRLSHHSSLAGRERIERRYVRNDGSWVAETSKNRIRIAVMNRCDPCGIPPSGGPDRLKPGLRAGVVRVLNRLHGTTYLLSFVLSVCIAFLLTAPSLGAELDWHDESGFRWCGLNVNQNGRVGFSRLSAGQTGVAFSNSLSEEAIAANRVLANGSGVAVGDYDGDGLPDIYFCGLQTPNTLYRNLGNWQFKDVSETSGVACVGRMCRGAVFADLNGDRSLDLLVSTVSEGVLCFLNNGSGRFTDVTASAGTKSPFAPMTIALADVDGNGTLDFYVANNRPDDIRDRGRLRVPVVNGKPSIPAQYRNRLVFRNGRVAEYGQPDQLFLNNGKGQFRAVRWDEDVFLDERGKAVSVPPLDWGLTVTFRDVNQDSAPDIYVCNDFWTPDRFWINKGNGRFQAIDPIALRKTSASSMGVDFGDLDRDGDVDFFVLDMLSRSSSLRKRQGMADKPEITPIGMIDDRPQVMRNTLFQNRGDGTFAEVARVANLAASDWSWSPVCLDVDFDGFEDLLTPAGHFRDVQDMDAEMQIRARQHSWEGYPNEAARQKAFTQELLQHNRLYPSLLMPIIAFHNTKDWTFEETTQIWGFGQEQVVHGIGLGDFDRDGDLDLVGNALNGAAAIYRNETSAPRVLVRLKGLSPNTQGIGAKVILHNGAIPVQSTEIISGGRYLSGSEAAVSFASGVAEDEMTVEVNWRGGLRSLISGVKPNRAYEIDEAGAQSASADAQRSSEPLDVATNPQIAVFNPKSNPIQNRESKIQNLESARPFFEDMSEAINHSHHETEFNDFERQPLLPFRFSRQGPGVGWFDLDGDGHDDLIVGAGSGGAPAIFRGDGAGGFSKVEPAAAWSASSDTAGIVGWSGTEGQRLLFGMTGYEAAGGHGVEQIRSEGGRWTVVEPIASEMSGASVLALGDSNGDGRLSLFVGGGVKPGEYPVGAPSKIYRHDGRRWNLDARNSALFERLGIVNGAVWSDLTGDGQSELVLACEWGPVRLFQSRGGVLYEITERLGLTPFTGWWKGVTTGDLDGDGRLDIIASNWGLNSPYRAGTEKPLVFVYGQLAQPGVTEIIETEYGADGVLTPRHPFMTLAASLPFLFEQFASHKDYSEASLDRVLGERRVLGRRAEISTLESMVFLNRDGRFDAIPLPREAQFAPAFGVNVGDFDGDGNEDVFLSQNFFATRPEMPRMDAGRGLWLRGDGKGGLSAVPGNRSGIKVYGEQRGSALADFDEDGRIDLAVTQNGAATKIYRNVGGSPGLRVKLMGPPGNPRGIGAVIRLQYENELGPAREIHAGSGYWSQDSSTQVLGMSGELTAVQVRWTGDKVTSTPVEAGAKELTIGFD